MRKPAPAFLATFADNYTRTIAHPRIKSLAQATAYARDLESWFASGDYPGRTLQSVAVKEDRLTAD
jgi:hypothetical protein